MLIFLMFFIFAMTSSADIIDRVNFYRKLHRVEPVTYASTLSKSSQLWADNIASSKTLAHSETTFGENLASFGGYSLSEDEFLNKSVDLWYNEVNFYKFENPGFSPETGHFTQLIWRSTTKIGYGISRSGSNTYVVMQFDPCGNVNNQFDQNVLSKTISKPSPPSQPPSLPLPLPSPSP